MSQCYFEFLDADNNPIAKCRYQIMQFDSMLREDITDETGRAVFNTKLISGKKIWVRFWAQGQRKDAAFSTKPFYWVENVVIQPIMAPRVYEIRLRETENKNDEPKGYRQAFYEVQPGDTWEGIAEKFGTQKIFIYEESCSDGDNPIVGAKLLLPHGCKR